MVERVEELNLPNAVISKLVKEALPPGVNVSKEAKSAITRAASVFILYLTSTANTNRLKLNKKKMFSSQHVFDALEEIEFDSFVSPLTEALEAYRQNLKEKKDKKKPNPGENTDNAEENTEEPDAVEEIHSDEEVDK